MPAKYDIATDLDDVVVNITDVWVKKILSDKGLCARLPIECVDKAVGSHPMNRAAYTFTSHFTEKHEEVFDSELLSLVHDKYFQDPNFYDDLQPSKYYFHLKAMLDYGVLNSVTVVTSCVELAFPVTASKMRFMNRIFDSFRAQGVQVRFILTEKKEKKSEAMVANNVVYDSYADDAIFNIVDVIENTQSHGKEFFIPRYRHNLIVPDQAKLVAKSGARIFWFDNDLMLSGDRLVDRRSEHRLPCGQELVWDR